MIFFWAADAYFLLFHVFMRRRELELGAVSSFHARRASERWRPGVFRLSALITDPVRDHRCAIHDIGHA